MSHHCRSRKWSLCCLTGETMQTQNYLCKGWADGKSTFERENLWGAVCQEARCWHITVLKLDFSGSWAAATLCRWLIKEKNAFSPLKINLALIYSGEGLDDGGTDQTERRRINTTAEQKTAKGCAQRYYFIQAWSVWIQRHIKAIWGNFSIIWPLKWQETEKYQSHDQSLSHKVTKPTKRNQNIKSIFFAALDLFVHLISICLMNHMCKDFSFFLWQFSKPEIRSRRYQNHDLSFKQHFAINQSIRHS